MIENHCSQQKMILTLVVSTLLGCSFVSSFSSEVLLSTSEHEKNSSEIASNNLANNSSTLPLSSATLPLNPFTEEFIIENFEPLPHNDNASSIVLINSEEQTDVAENQDEKEQNLTTEMASPEFSGSLVDLESSSNSSSKSEIFNSSIKPQEADFFNFDLQQEHRSDEGVDMKASANSVQVKIVQAKQKGLAAKVADRLRKGQAGKILSLISHHRQQLKSRTDDKNSVKIYAGDDGKKKGNVIVVSNGGGSSSEPEIKQHLVQHIIPIFAPINDPNEKMDEKANLLGMFSPPIISPIPLSGPVRLPNLNPRPGWQNLDGPSSIPELSAIGISLPGTRTAGRRTRHIFSNLNSDSEHPHPLIHPMTETVNPDEAASPSQHSLSDSILGLSEVNLGDLIRETLATHNGHGSSSQNLESSQSSDDLSSTFDSEDRRDSAQFAQIKGFSLSDSSNAANLRTLLSAQNRFTDLGNTGLTGSDDRLLSLLLEQPRFGVEYSGDRLNLADRLSLLGGQEFSPNPLSKLNSLIGDDIGLDYGLKKNPIFEILNRKQIPLSSQLFDELRSQVGQGSSLHDHSLHQHLQHEVNPTHNLNRNLRQKLAQNARKSNAQEEDDTGSESGKNTEERRAKSRSHRLRMTLQARLREQKERLKGRLRGATRDKAEEEEEEYEEAGKEDEGEESRESLKRAKPPQTPEIKEAETLSGLKAHENGQSNCESCCFGAKMANLKPDAVSAIRAILLENSRSVGH